MVGQLQSWMGQNLTYSLLVAGVVVIVGAAMALKTEKGSMLGWIVVAGGVAFGFWAMKLKGLV